MFRRAFSTIKNVRQRRGIQTQYEKDVFGYRRPREFRMEDYTAEEQLNRRNNANLMRLVYAYRQYGHLAANLDPLGIQEKPPVPELVPSRYGIPETGATYDLSGLLHVGKKGSTTASKTKATIEEILAQLKRTYCGNIAYEFRHVPNISERRWFAHMVESFEKKKFNEDEKKRIFSLLTRSEVFDQFMSKRFSQVKRYGLEGAESMMVALDTLFRSSSQGGIVDVVFCMPHRGRLNLLTDLLQYSPTALFHKIKGNSEFPENLNVSGDVLSHLANSIALDYGTKRPLRVTMLHNPSHLEAVNPVALGKARAKQTDLLLSAQEGADCSLGDRVLCVQLHGDGAFAGQGVVAETLCLSNLPHFTVGGTVHVVVNNQIGYTTPAVNARSSTYATDVGKMINAPVIHVNGDHPEEPAFTQPLMYKIIRSRESVPQMYEKKLLKEGVLQGQDEIDAFRQTYFKTLDEHMEASKTYQPVADHLSGKWKGLIHPDAPMSQIDTGVAQDILKNVAAGSVTVPNGFTVHPRLLKHHIQARLSAVEKGEGIDWATAEAMALGSLLVEGYGVRLSGQDVGRGTFSQRHVMLVDQESEKTVIPLNSLSENQGRFEIANSNLSELAVLGFEYGMSLESPKQLNIWEAQFGDFFNGAQIIIDTYINSGEQKWLRQSGLVMLLPHGYDGAGPEHSSCRVERFLQLSDEVLDLSNGTMSNPNWHIINPTTPAQYFHALRRQLKRPFRKPLVVVGPKKLLKLPAAVSSLSDMTPGTTFQPILGDPIVGDMTGNIQRVVFVSGKLYYELAEERAKRDLNGVVALVRVEEMCPFPKDHISKVLEKFQHVSDFVWCQEEPQNMGAFTYMQPRLDQLLPNGEKIRYIGREPAAAPATGIGKIHKAEQATLINTCFE